MSEVKPVKASPAKSGRPAGVIFAAIYLILEGLLSFGLGVFFSIVAPASLLGALFGILEIISAIGVLKMKRWALYLITGLVGLNLIISAYSLLKFHTAPTVIQQGEMLIGILIVVYLWKIKALLK